MVKIKSKSRANGLSSIRHTEETQDIMFIQLKVENDSDFIRKAIVHLAQKNGFLEKPTTQPAYISIDKWTMIRQLDLSSFIQKNGKMVGSRGDRSVDYTYLYAFWFLHSLEKYQHAHYAELQRCAIIDYGTKMIAEK